eukprot:m.82277 g.82277  ORF g.82277 m.82277 type:complete len:724 (-) comp14612_c0_seq1:27-2198(-)
MADHNDRTGYKSKLLADRTGYQSPWVARSEFQAHSDSVLKLVEDKLPPAPFRTPSGEPTALSTVPSSIGFVQAAAAAGLTILQRLGSNDTAHGAVFKCRRETDGTIFAIKWLQHRQDLEGYQMRRLREMRAHKVLPSAHPHLVTVESMGSLGNDEYLLMELCDSTWQSYLQTPGSLDLSDLQFVSWFHQALCGLQQIHAHKLLHKDVQPGNVFFVRSPDDAGGTVFGVKLGDYGLSEPISSREYQSPIAVYMVAPELWSQLQPNQYSLPVNVFTEGADIWSTCATMALGLLRATLGTSVDWWLTDLGAALFAERWEANLSKVQDRFGDDIVSIILGGLAIEPGARDTLEELLLRLEEVYGLPRPSVPVMEHDFDQVFAGLAIKVASERRRAGDPAANGYLQLAQMFGASPDVAFEQALQTLRKVQGCMGRAEEVGEWSAETRAEFEAACSLTQQKVGEARGVEPVRDKDAAKLLNVQLLLTLEVVKADLLAEKYVEACIEALAALDKVEDWLRKDVQLAQEADTDKLQQHWRLLLFQHTRNYALLMVTVAEHVLERDDMLTKGRHHMTALLDEHIPAAAISIRAYNQAAPVARWRDEWALLFEEARLARQADRQTLCMRACTDLFTIAADANDWMLVARSWYVRLQAEMRFDLSAAEGTANKLVHQYQQYQHQVPNSTYGLKNAKRHLTYVEQAQELSSSTRDHARDVALALVLASTQVSENK